MTLLKRLVIITLSITLCLSSQLRATEFDRKLIVVGEEFAPFEFVKDGEVVGVDIDIATHIFQKLDIPIVFRIMPWKRAWQMVESGEADAVLTTSRKITREPYLWYPKESMWVSEFVFFVNKDRVIADFNGYETIKKYGLGIGVINGNSYHNSFWEAFPYQDGSTTFQGENSTAKLHPQIFKAHNAVTNLYLLAAKKRTDVFLIDRIIGKYTAKLLGLENQLSHYEPAVYTKPYFMPFVKKSTYPAIKTIANKFDEELRQLKESGEYKRFLDRWIK